MGREHFLGKPAYHHENGQTGVILDVHLNVSPQTAHFLPDGRERASATWVNLASLKLMPPGKTEDVEPQD